MTFCLKTIEAKWEKYWEEQQTYKFVDDLGKPKFYILDMFPYPSGSGLHVGHIKGYLATDILARYKKMKGFCVLHPIGWDAFGLPAEQFAIKNKKNPKEFTELNINCFRKQLKNLMFSYDYSIEVNTCDPSYYGITQWIFAKLYEHNLAYLANTYVNWCPQLNTVLANEEIIETDGVKLSERGGYPVVPKKLSQWMLKITDYAESLISGLDLVDWDDNIKKIQHNWIGKSKKYPFTFTYKDKEYGVYLNQPEDIKRLVGIYIHDFSSLFEYISQEGKVDLGKLSDRDSLGIELICSYSGVKVPVYYLKDIDFREDDLLPKVDRDIELSSAEIDLIRNDPKIIPITRYLLKDWVFSRQRYWGEPFPIYYGKNNEVYLEDKLPVLLPEIKDFEIFLQSGAPLANIKEWVNVDEDHLRDTNTMPNWAGSSWYFISYLLKQEDGSYLSLDSKEAKEKIDRWLPVDVYVGGQEHATLHLLYARFWFQFLNNIGITEVKEPFKKLVNQGMILSSDGSKMSKSKQNTVSTEEIFNLYGSNVMRLNMAFIGPTEASQKWDDTQLLPLKKWLEKIYVYFSSLNLSEALVDGDEKIAHIENALIDNVEYAIEKFRCNVIVSELMIFFNALQKHQVFSLKALRSFIKILSLLAPSFAEEIWEGFLKGKGSIYLSEWPVKNILEVKEYGLSVRINHKHKLEIKLSYDVDDVAVPMIVEDDEEFIKLLNNRKIVKKVYIPKKMINYIVSE